MEQKRYNAPELLAPVGDMERLISAVRYGADAVYLAGKSFGMRSAPSNFTNEELEEAVKYCHAQGVKVYVTCNILPHNAELAALPAFHIKAILAKTKVLYRQISIQCSHIRFNT